MSVPSKPVSKNLFAFDNEIYLTDSAATSTYSYENNSAWSVDTSFGATSSYLTATGWLIDAGNGGDLIDASASTGDNTLSGGNGSDTLIGGAGDDRLDGSNGDDELTGNEGADVFVWSGGNDVISDFSPRTEGERSVVTIGFEDALDPASFAGSLNGQPYKNLIWTNVQILSKDFVGGSVGFSAVIDGLYVGFILNGAEMSFENPSQDFDFIGGDFASTTLFDTWNTVRAYDDGVLVGALTFSTSALFKSEVNFEDLSIAPGSATLIIDPDLNRFTSVDKITITPADPFVTAFDNLQLAFPSTSGDGDGDTIDVPDGFNLPAYIASATNDGDGNTILTDGTNSLKLIGIAAEDVSASWFV